MSTGVVAASAAAVAMYWYLFKQKGLQDDAMEPVLPVEACRNAPDHAPSNWGEALFHVKEVLRYMYNETLGRWHTIDLFVGLAYLSHREALDYPAADIAAKGVRVELGSGSSVNEQIKLILELQEARRYMLYCKGLKLRREEMQARFWREHLGADTLSIVKQQATAGVLRPAYVVVCDHALRAVVLCIRGTHSMKDLFTSLAGAAKPHHVVDPATGQLVLGYSHLGMLAAARWLARQVTPLLRQALADSPPGYQLRIVGHSMGGGTAALLTMMFRGGLPGAPSSAGVAAGAAGAGAASPAPGPGPSPRPDPWPSSSTTDPAVPAPGPSSSTSPSASDEDPFLSARCVAIACPSVVTLELAAACREYVTSIVHGTDIVPTFCAASVDRLREDVTRSSWFTEFSRDMRSGVVRALQGGVRGVGTATQWTSRNILQPAVVPFRACYATTASRRSRRRAAASAATLQSAGAAAAAAAASAAAAAASAATGGSSLLDGTSASPSSPSLAQLAAAEQQEQLLLAAGAGGGAAAAAAAAAAVAALDGGGSVGMLSPSTSAAILAAWGESHVGLGGAAGAGAVPLPPGLQSMSPGGGRFRGAGGGGAGGGGGAAGTGGNSGVDQRAMAEAVQSCMYAVNSAVSAHHHQHHQHHHQAHPHGGSSGHQQRSASDAAISEALGLLESLPQELGPPGAAAAAGAGTSSSGPGSVRSAGHSGHHHSHPHHHDHQHHHHGRSLEALDAPDPWRRPATAFGGSSDGGGGAASSSSAVALAPSPLAADSLLAGSTAAALGAGGVSTAMVYGSSLRRRLWPWGQGQGQDGAATAGGGGGAGAADGGPGSSSATSLGAGLSIAGGGAGGLGFGVCGGGLGAGTSASGSYGALCELDGGGGGGGGGRASMTPPRMSAPDSPGKAKARAAAPGGGGGAGGGSGVVGGGMAALASTRAFGDWLWRGGGLLFATCTTPRRAGGPAGMGPARGGGGGGGGAASGPLLMDVGDGYDDESDPEPEDSAGGNDDDDDSGSSEGDSPEGEEEGEEEDEEEEEGEGRVGGAHRPGAEGGDGGGGGGLAGSSAAADSEQQLQAGITAVVAAVTNQASREAAEGPSALLRDENTLAAEDVLREVREAEAEAEAGAGAGTAAVGAAAGEAVGGTGVRSRRRREPRSGGETASAAGARRPARGRRTGAAAIASAPQSATGVTGPRVGLTSRGTSDAALAEEDEPPLSPTGSGIASPTSGGGGLAALSAEYEARLYKRRLYPAGRILHLFPGAAVTGGQHHHAAGTVAGAAAACTTPLDAAAARASAAAAPHVLFEVRDPQAYSRVRLCRTMVSDHLIPAYLTALDSVLAQLEDQQQRAAREAWEREQERERQELETEQEQQWRL